LNLEPYTLYRYWIRDKTGYDQDGQFLCSGIDQFMKVADRDVYGFSRPDFLNPVFYLNQTAAGLNDIDLLHGITVAAQFFTWWNRGMGQEHEGLQMSGIQDHMGETAFMSPVAGGPDFRVVQMAYYHGFVL
jgi:hypothetical protein